MDPEKKFYHIQSNMTTFDIKSYISTINFWLHQHDLKELFHHPKYFFFNIVIMLWIMLTTVLKALIKHTTQTSFYEKIVLSLLDHK